MNISGDQKLLVNQRWIQNFSQEWAPIPGGGGAPAQYFEYIFWKTLWN